LPPDDAQTDCACAPQMTRMQLQGALLELHDVLPASAAHASAA